MSTTELLAIRRMMSVIVCLNQTVQLINLDLVNDLKRFSLTDYCMKNVNSSNILAQFCQISTWIQTINTRPRLSAIPFDHEDFNV